MRAQRQKRVDAVGYGELEDTFIQSSSQEEVFVSHQCGAFRVKIVRQKDSSKPFRTKWTN